MAVLTGIELDSCTDTLGSIGDEFCLGECPFISGNKIINSWSMAFIDKNRQSIEHPKRSLEFWSMPGREVETELFQQSRFPR